ncbi:kinase-like domain-containing protein [Xylaria venustula]|nr:kinase-like domain-containing protein [Xylaria venustula]
MKPQSTSWSDFAHVSEEFDSATREFQYTMFAMISSDDTIHYGELPMRKAEISFEQVSATLQPIPDHEIFPEWPSSGIKQLTQDPSAPTVFIKRPNLPKYDVYKRYNVVHLLARSLLEEAHTMEFLSAHPHPNLIRYHGCRAQRGYLTGIVLDYHPHNLEDYLKNRTGTIDKSTFMDALESAIHHLHSLGWAHNDLNPSNVLVDACGKPVLIDFGSALEVGKLLGTSRGTSGWIEGRIEDYTTSRKENDIFALEKIRVWLDNPTFDDEEEED